MVSLFREWLDSLLSQKILHVRTSSLILIEKTCLFLDRADLLLTILDNSRIPCSSQNRYQYLHLAKISFVCVIQRLWKKAINHLTNAHARGNTEITFKYGNISDTGIQFYDYVKFPLALGIICIDPMSGR